MDRFSTTNRYVCADQTRQRGSDLCRRHPALLCNRDLARPTSVLDGLFYGRSNRSSDNLAGYCVLPNRAKHRERLRKQAEEEVRRAAAAQVRGEKFDKAKSAMAGAARTAGDSAAGFAKAGISEARDRFDTWRTKPKTE